MKQAVGPLIAAISLSLAVPVFAQGNAAPVQDGVKVGEMSFMRKFAPTGALEKQAALQYTQTMQQAEQQKALGPDNHPQVIRLRAIAKKTDSICLALE